MNQWINKLEIMKKCIITFFTMAFIYLAVKAIRAYRGNFEQQKKNKDI